MEILHGQQVFGAGLHPVARRRPLTRRAGGTLSAGRAVPVLAAVVGDVMVVALSATGHMPAERLGSTGLDRRHHLELGQADMPSMPLPPRRAMGTKEVSDLQLGSGQFPPRLLQTSFESLVLQASQHLKRAGKRARKT